METSPVCLDANLVMSLLIENPQSVRVRTMWIEWREGRRQLAAPTLLFYEISNALYKYVRARYLQPDEAQDLLNGALALDIAVYGDAALHLRALQMADSLNLPAAYDAHYLALAERLGAEFWTADRRLYDAVAGLAVAGPLPFVRLLPL